MKRLTRVLIAFLGLMLMPILPANATITPINLNDFYADPTVMVAADGSSALLGEDPFFSPVLLSNDPGLGDLEVIFAQIGGVPQILSFDFDFDETAGDNDEFGAFVIDGSTGDSVGSAYEFFTQTSSSGSVFFDLTPLAGLPLKLGLQFQLTALFGDAGLDSTVAVSNVYLAPVPEPATLLLVGTGLFGLLGLGRKKFRKQAGNPATSL